MVPPNPNAPTFVQQVPLMDMAKELFPLLTIKRLCKAYQNARVPKAQQSGTAIGQSHVKAQLQQL
jgi:hypothetical protein